MNNEAVVWFMISGIYLTGFILFLVITTENKIKTMKTRTICVLLTLYLLGGFLTNSYVRKYRWPEWKEQDTEYEKYTNLKIFTSTVFWPIYTLSRLSDEIVDITQ